MIPNTIKERLKKDRPMGLVSIRIPDDVVESLKTIAPLRGFSGYQALVKSYISEGLRRDEAALLFDQTSLLIDALKKRGVSEELLDEAAKEIRRTG